MDTERLLSDQTVLIQGGWIIALGPAHKIQIPAEAVRIDGQGQYLIPGLADMHAHLAEEYPGGEYASDSFIEHNKLWSRWLSRGVTTIRNLDWASRRGGEQALRLKARAAAGELWSPRIYTSGLWSDSVVASKRINRTKPEEVAQQVLTYKAAGYDFIKVHSSESVETFDSLIAVTRRLGIPVVGHAPLQSPPGEDPLTLALRAHMQSIEHLTGFHQYLYLKHVQPELPPTPGDPQNNKDFMDALFQRLDAAQPTIQALAKTIQQAGVWNCPTIAIYTKLHTDTLTALYMNRITKALQDAGAGLLLGTDAVFGYQITVQDELQALVGAGLTPYQALRTGTYNVAQFFGTLDSSGTVAVGKRADLVLLTGNPLQDIKYTVHPAGVMIGGRWLSRADIDRGLTAVKAAAAASP